MKEKKSFNSFLKENLLFITAIIIVIVLASYIGHKIGYNNATTILKDKKFTIEQIEEEVSSVEQALDESKKEEEEKYAEIEQLREEYREVTTLVNTKGELQTNLDELKANSKQKEEEITSLDTEIKKKKKELEKLENGIVEKKEEPRNLPAGEFEVGKDIPAGRYKVQPNGGSGNFFVNDGITANVILGNSSSDEMFLKEYTMNLSDGDKISSNLPTKYIPVE